MDVMSSLGIVCAVSIICFASEEFEQYSLYYKIVIFLLAEQILLCLKFFIQYFLPGDPQWVEDLAARNEYIWWVDCVLSPVCVLSCVCSCSLCAVVLHYTSNRYSPLSL